MANKEITLKGNLNGINNVIDLIEKGNYDDALEIMIEVQPLKDCEQNNPHHIYNVYDHIIKTVEYVEYGLRSVVSHMTLEDNKQFFIDNEEELIKLFKLVMLLHDTGKPNCKKVNTKTGYDSFIKHEKESEEIADYILSDDFIYKKLVLWLIKNHEYINGDTCTNKKSIRKKYNSLEEVVKQLSFDIESANIMFMIPMLRIADINGQSKFNYSDKFDESMNFIKTLEEVIAAE